MELEETKNHLNRLETANTGVELQLCWHHLHVKLIQKTTLFASRRVYETHFMRNFGNSYPLRTLHIAGLRIYTGKNLIAMNWNIVRGK